MWKFYADTPDDSRILSSTSFDLVVHSSRKSLHVLAETVATSHPGRSWYQLRVTLPGTFENHVAKIGSEIVAVHTTATALLRVGEL